MTSEVYYKIDNAESRLFLQLILRFLSYRKCHSLVYYIAEDINATFYAEKKRHKILDGLWANNQEAGKPPFWQHLKNAIILFSKIFLHQTSCQYPVWVLSISINSPLTQFTVVRRIARRRCVIKHKFVQPTSLILDWNLTSNLQSYMFIWKSETKSDVRDTWVSNSLTFYTKYSTSEFWYDSASNYAATEKYAASRIKKFAHTHTHTHKVLKNNENKKNRKEKRFVREEK